MESHGRLTFLTSARVLEPNFALKAAYGVATASSLRFRLSALPSCFSAASSYTHKDNRNHLK
jgi:hypothetical protein